MKKEKTKKTYLKFTENHMAVYLYLNPEDKEGPFPFTKERILQFLKEYQVIYGIKEEVLDFILSEKIYFKEVMIAEGLEPEDGEDGRFEFKFNPVWKREPKLNVDGSINYWRISVVDLVVQGQTIALYNPATKGKKGITVKGNEVYGTMGKELLPLKGKGFERSKDNRIYTSLIDGKIEYKNERIYITELYEWFGNIDCNTGNIDFRGDVIIHGNVDSGVMVNATGCIIVDGKVNSSKLTAGKDIILRSGISGGYVKASGTVFARYLDSVTLETSGSVYADSIFHSKVYSGDKTIVAGERGFIIGGEVRGVNGVEAVSLGSKYGIKTKVFAGMSKDTYQKMLILKEKMEEAEAEIRLADQIIGELEEERESRLLSVESEPRLTLWIQSRNKNLHIYRNCSTQLEILKALVKKAEKAYIKVETKAYPETILAINEISKNIFEIN